MIKKRIIIILLSALITAIYISGYNITPLKANAQAEVTSVLDTPFETITDGTAKVSIDGIKFMVGGKELWFNGVNTPWDHWNDFGGTGSGHMSLRMAEKSMVSIQLLNMER